LDDGDDEPMGRDEVVARELAHGRIDLAGRGRSTQVAADDLAPV
jgi:hypothetical protein